MRARLFACALAIPAAACSGSSSTEVTAPSTIKCEVAVENTLRGAAPASGTSSTLTVTTARDCTWTAASDSPWLTISSGANGQGNGSVAYTVAANGQAAQRRGNLTVSSAQITVVQDAAPCRFTVAPPNTTVSQSGGQLSVTVEALAGCGWTAQSNVSWMSIGSGASGNGSGTVALQVGANSADARTGTVTIAGTTVTVTQSPAPCTFTVAPASQNVPAGGASLSVNVTVRPGCAWTAASGVAWITIGSGATSSGNGTVTAQIAANAGDARSGSLTIAGTTVAVSQAPAPCTFSVTPLSQSVPVEGAAGSASVTVRPGCSWTAVSSVPWILFTSASGGNGNGVISFAVAPNPGPPRNGTLTIAGFTFTVAQATVPCFYTIGPRTQFIGGDGGTGTTSITTGPTCPWTAVPNVPWIVMLSAASGIGEGRVVFAITANAGDSRTGTLTVAGDTYTVIQGAARIP